MFKFLKNLYENYKIKHTKIELTPKGLRNIIGDIVKSEMKKAIKSM